MKRFTLLVAVLLMSIAGFGQYVQNTRVRATDYGSWEANLTADVAASGTAFNVAPCVFLPANNAGKQFSPFAVNVPISLTGGTGETVTPTAVSAFVYDSSVKGGCYVTITATVSNAHSKGSSAVSGDGGILEAAARNPRVVLLDGAFATDTAVTALTPGTNSPILEDLSTGVLRYYTIQPNILTALATPATRSATAGTTQVISGTAVGTWTAVATYVCVTYVDRLGGESPCSATYNFTATVSVALNFASPAASTGAVGWRAYAGVTSLATAYQLPISSTTCTLSTQTPYPTCAIGSAGVFPTPTTTTALHPGYVVNTYNPNTQGHTTFAYQLATKPSLSCGQVQTNYGPFIASSGGTTGQIEVLGTVQLPSGCINAIGKAIRVSGHITMTAGASETPVLKVQLGPTFTTGTPTNICQFANTTALSAAVYSLNFTCTITTNATGASGTVVPGGMAVVALGAGTTAGTSMPELGTAAITDKLDTVNYLFVTYIPTSGTNTAAQLIDLHLEEI